MTDHTHDVVEDEIHYCEVHPDEETSLRCNRCGRYMCVKCANRTPVGYTCNECFRGHEDKFYHATQNDYLISGWVSFILAAIATGIYYALGTPVIGLPIIFAFIGLPIGGVIGEFGLRATQRRRGRQSHWVASISAFVGAVMSPILISYFQFQSDQALFGAGSSIDFGEYFRVYLQFMIGQNLSLWLFIVLLVAGVYGMYKSGRTR